VILSFTISSRRATGNRCVYLPLLLIYLSIYLYMCVCVCIIVESSGRERGVAVALCLLPCVSSPLSLWSEYIILLLIYVSIYIHRVDLSRHSPISFGAKIPDNSRGCCSRGRRSGTKEVLFPPPSSLSLLSSSLLLLVSSPSIIGGRKGGCVCVSLLLTSFTSPPTVCVSVYIGERDLVIARAVFNYLCLENLKDANIVFESFLEQYGVCVCGCVIKCVVCIVCYNIVSVIYVVCVNQVCFL